MPHCFATIPPCTPMRCPGWDWSVISAALGFAAAALAVAGTASIHGARPRKARRGFTRRLAAVVPARLRPPLDLAARLEAAGSHAKPAEFMALKALAAIAGAPLGAAAATAARGWFRRDLRPVRRFGCSVHVGRR